MSYEIVFQKVDFFFRNILKCLVVLFRPALIDICCFVAWYISTWYISTLETVSKLISEELLPVNFGPCGSDDVVSAAESRAGACDITIGEPGNAYIPLEMGNAYIPIRASLATDFCLYIQNKTLHFFPQFDLKYKRMHRPELLVLSF